MYLVWSRYVAGFDNLVDIARCGYEYVKCWYNLFRARNYDYLFTRRILKLKFLYGMRASKLKLRTKHIHLDNYECMTKITEFNDQWIVCYFVY